MPATSEELIRIVHVFCDQTIMPDDITDIVWLDGDKVSHAELREILVLSRYEMYYRSTRKQPAQRKAVKLLRSLLSAEQRKSIRNNGYFHIQVRSGNYYRIHPNMYPTKRVEKHGKRMFALGSYCLHPDLDLHIPHGDVAVSHMLMLKTDEEEFLKLANYRLYDRQLWNRDYLRSLRENTITQNIMLNEEAIMEAIARSDARLAAMHPLERE
jgi:hypothetical protein